MIAVGTRIGEYEIVAPLRAGGMASLFLAKRAGVAGFSRHVAIKVIHQHLSTDETFVSMFVDEALLSSKIHHPNVVHVEELGQFDGAYFLVMEYVHGCSLTQLIRGLGKVRRRLSPDVATSIALHVADGLNAAHQATNEKGEALGVVHRDVSPENVLLSYKGHVKLIDFGIAKARGRSQQTTGGSLKGKFRYMSPEQAYGHAVDHRTDVYALGIVHWEMLTGRRLFTADTDLALLETVRKPKVPAPSKFVADIPAKLDAAILRALAPERHNRPASAYEYRRMLVDALPAALAIDATHIADLLNSAMREQIERDARSLPQSVSGVVRPPGEPPAVVASEDAADDIVLKTFTTTVSELESLDDSPPDGSSGRSPLPGVASLAIANAHRNSRAPQGRSIPALLVASGLVCVVAAGLVLWSRASRSNGSASVARSATSSSRPAASTRTASSSPAALAVQSAGPAGVGAVPPSADPARVPPPVAALADASAATAPSAIPAASTVVAAPAAVVNPPGDASTLATHSGGHRGTGTRGTRHGSAATTGTGAPLMTDDY